MSENLNEATKELKIRDLIADLGQRILDGGQITRDEAIELINIESNADIMDLLSWANRIRENFKGNKIHLCSIVNAKAVFPIPGLAATIIKSDFCHPEVILSKFKKPVAIPLKLSSLFL